MNKHKTRLLAGCLAVGFFMTNVFSSDVFAATSKTQSVVTESPSLEQRLSGVDRYETAAKIAQEGWKATSEYAVLSAGMDENLVDALAAAPLAKLKNAPVLLTEGDVLNKYAETELKRLGVKTVYVTTGDKVITKKVLEKLAELNITVVPLGGSNRFETALNIAKQMGIFNKLVVATAWNNADALSVASIAAAKGMPILLSDVNEIPDNVMTYINTVKDKVAQTYVLGGKGALTDNVKNALPNATRVGGLDRFGTNIEVLKTFTTDLKFSKTYLANGEDGHLVDALAGSPLVAQTSSAVVLTGIVLPSTTKEFAKLNLGPNVITFGGEAVVPKSVVEQLSSVVVYSEDGATIGSADVNKLEDINDSVKITAKDVTLMNAKTAYSVIIQGDKVVLDNVTIAGTLFIDPGAKGTANINNVKAGKIVILSGAKDSIHLKNTEAGTLVVSSSSDVRVESSGTTQIGNTVVTSYAVLDAAGGSLGSVEVISVAGQAPVVTFKGTFDQPIVVSGSATIVADANAKIAKLEISPESKDQKITLDGKFTMVEVNKEAKVELSANTTVTNVITNVKAELNVPSGASIGTLDKKGNDVPVSGSGNVGGSTSSSGGGGGGSGGGSSGGGGGVIAVSAITVTGADTVVDGQTLQLGVTVEPANATNKTVTWAVTNGTGTAVIDASTGLLRATGVGTIRVTATNAASGVTGSKDITVAAPADTTAPTISKASLRYNGNPQLFVDFQISEEIDYTDPDANVIISYQIKNGDGSYTEVYKKDRTWSGYLCTYPGEAVDGGVETKYNPGPENDPRYLAILPAGKTISTSVSGKAWQSQGYLSYLKVVITVTDNAGNSTVEEVTAVTDADKVAAAKAAVQALCLTWDTDLATTISRATMAISGVTLPAGVTAVAAEGTAANAGKVVITITSGTETDATIVLEASVTPSDSIVPATAVYDRYTYATLDIPMTLNGNTLTKISDGSYLTLGEDYTVAENTVILAKAYMQAKAVGNVTLTFTFSAGATGTCVITVSDSTPAPVTLSSIAVKIPATKLIYTVGETLDITGLVIEGTYSDGSKKDETVVAADVTGFDSTAVVTSQTLTVKVGGKLTTYTVEIKYTAGTKFISNEEELSAAIVAQADGQTWIIKKGIYDLPKDKVYNAQGVDEEWYFPIHKSIKIYGEGNPTLTSTTYSTNGAWASQNFITVFADNVSIQGVVIKTKEESNKVIEILGRDFNLKDVEFLENTRGTSGLIYFNPNNTAGQTKDMGNIVLENVNLKKGDISYRDNAWGSGEMKGSLTFKNVTIDNREYGIPFNYGAIVDPSNPNTGITSAKLAVSADNLKIRLDNLASDLPFLNNFFAILKPGTTVELAAGIYQVPEELMVPTGVTLDTTTNNVIIEVLPQGAVSSVSNEAELSAALIDPTKTAINITTSFSTTKKINVNRPVVINGGGKTITVSQDLGADNSSKHSLDIQTKGVTIKDLTINNDSKAYGVQAYGDASATLENLTIINSKGAGLTVNGSNVIATNLNTSGNAWGGVNVDPGSGVYTPSVFTLNGGVLADPIQIWSDGEHASATATIMVNASEYTLITYTPNYTGAVENSGKNWTNRPSMVFVNDITVTGEGDATTVVNGGTLQMSATVTPSNATDKTVIWSVTPGTGTAVIDASTGLLTAQGVGTVTVTATNAASGVARIKVITIIAEVEPNRIIITPSTGSTTVKQGEALVASNTVLSSNYAASGLTTYIGLSNSDNAAVNFDAVFTSFNLGTKVGSAAFDGPYNMNGSFSIFQYGPHTGYAVEAGVNQVTTLTGAVKDTAPVGVYTITIKIMSATTEVANSSYILTVTMGQNESLTSSDITNFNYENLYATQARAVSKTISTSNFKSSSAKNFTITDRMGNVIPVDMNVNIPLNEYTPTCAAAVGSYVESIIQMWFQTKYGLADWVSHMTVAASYDNDKLVISTFETGSSAFVQIGGNNWSEFYDNPDKIYGTDTSHNCTFTINDGTNSVTITLSRSYADMVNLVRDINDMLSKSQVSAVAEKVDDSHFRLVTKKAGIHLTVDGPNKGDFFSSFVSQ